MSKSKWGIVSLTAGILAFVFGSIAVFFSVTSIVTLKKYRCISLKKAED